MIAEENWRPVYGWEGFYEVSDMGRVRSIARLARSTFGLREYGGGILKPIFHKRSGYLVVNLVAENKRRKQVLLHRLVLESFSGPCPDNMECCHCNGNKLDPRLTNLRWDTRKANHADKRKHGTWQGGEANPNHKLTTSQVIAIKTSGDSVRDLAERFQVSQGCIKHVLNRETWIHIEVNYG